MIRRLLLSATALAAVAGPALAADLPYRQAPPVYVPPPIFSWTGLYLGAQIGYSWGTDNLTGYNQVGALFVSNSSKPNGVIGGAFVGYNLQIGQVVAGLEGDVEGTGYSKSVAVGGLAFATNVPVQGSIRLRLGYALDRALLYITGGAAFAGFENTYSSAAGYDSIGKTRTGWTVGGGIEYAVTNNWTIRAEYRYSDYGTLQRLPDQLGAGRGARHVREAHGEEQRGSRRRRLQVLSFDSPVVTTGEPHFITIWKYKTTRRQPGFFLWDPAIKIRQDRQAAHEKFIGSSRAGVAYGQHQVE